MADNAMRGTGLGRLAIDPRRVQDMVSGIGNAMTGIYGNIKAAVEGEPLYPQQALELGPGMLVPVFGRAGGLGAAGGKLTPARVEQIMRELEYQNIRTELPKTGTTQYVRGDPPGNPPRSAADAPIVRVPADTHLGRPLSGREVGNRFDTGTPDPTRRKIDERAYLNQGGEPYSDPAALEAALRWRRGDLVSPDAAPRGTRHLPELEAAPKPAPEGADFHPKQLKLLSRGTGLPPGFVLDNDNAMSP